MASNRQRIKVTASDQHPVPKPRTSHSGPSHTSHQPRSDQNVTFRNHLKPNILIPYKENQDNLNTTITHQSKLKRGKSIFPVDLTKLRQPSLLTQQEKILCEKLRQILNSAHDSNSQGNVSDNSTGCQRSLDNPIRSSSNNPVSPKREVGAQINERGRIHKELKSFGKQLLKNYDTNENHKQNNFKPIPIQKRTTEPNQIPPHPPHEKEKLKSEEKLLRGQYYKLLNINEE